MGVEMLVIMACLWCMGAASAFTAGYVVRRLLK